MYQTVLFHKLIVNALFAVDSNSGIIILTLLGAQMQLQVKMAVMIFILPVLRLCRD